MTMNQLPPDMMYMRALIANLVFVGARDSEEWVLVDTGIMTFADNIIELAKHRYRNTKPRAIVLTHGHFDHVGSLKELLKLWEDVPVYAQEKELPYLTGETDYPEPDPTVGGGLMSMLAPLYPNKAIDIRPSIRALPRDGAIPELPDWRWIPTPGHTKGHVSLFRDRDRTLIAGDAFITVKQESALAVITQVKEIHGPPTYFTPDWDEARASVQRLETLRPEAAITGHGVPMFGAELREGLATLARDFDRMAVPEHGRYVHQ
jgi:glyoxylase-like metal-dependent hydrolase (beta-lactamase superfamily II)